MGLLTKLNTMALDTRIVEWQLRQGQMTKEELHKHLEKLPDMAAQAEHISIDESDMDGDDDLNGADSAH